MPTRKLKAAIVTAVSLYVAAKVAPFDKELEHLINVVGPLVAAWITRNDSTATGDGVPSV